MTAASSKPIRAAVYARLSKEDRDAAGSGVESTALQRRDALATIAASKWTLVGEPFVDEGISGAEFLKRVPTNEARGCVTDRDEICVAFVPQARSLRPEGPYAQAACTKRYLPNKY